MPLTDTFVRNVKPSDKVQKISDGGGLHLRVEPRGSKLWRMQYAFGGKQKTLALGVYPAVSLADARKKRDQAKTLLSLGVDPSVEARLEKIRRAEGAANTFAAIADELVTRDKKEGRAEATLIKKRWIFDMVRTDIGSRPISQITPAEFCNPCERSSVQAITRRQSACAPPSAKSFAMPSLRRERRMIRRLPCAGR